jgi:predicted P-loop ATPase
MEWPMSEPVPVVGKPARSAVVVAVPTSLTILASALGVLDPGMAYDDWFRVLAALHNATGGSDDGLDLADSWSAAGANYPGRDEIEKKWASFGKHDGRREVTAGTLFNMARAAGWVEPVEDDFDVLPVVGGGVEERRRRPSYVRHEKTGEILLTMDNMVKAVSDPRECGMRLAYDQFRDEIVFSEDDGENWQPFKDADYVRLRIALERISFKPPTREITRDAVLLAAEQNRFDSAQLWLGRQQWDGVPRVEAFMARYLGVEDGAYARSVGRYLWTALAGRVLEPGCKADMAPVLVGDQGLGKSQAVAAIAPDPAFFAEINFAEKEDDISRKMRGRLVAELGELRGLHTKELESIKAFITRQHEDWTPKYREFNTVFPRRLVFIGTTNKDEFLADETGNRRWLPVRIGKVDLDALKHDRAQLWAEGAVLFTTGGVDFREAETLAAGVHAEHMMRDPWEPTVSAWLDEPDTLTGDKPAMREFLRVHDVLREALGFEAKQIKRVEEMRVGAVLRALGYTRKKLRIGGGPVWVYHRPAAG